MTINTMTGLENGIETVQKINEIISGKADNNADTTGNAGTATKLANSRTISLTGAVTGSASFDGSANSSITTTLANTTKIDGQWVSSVQTLSTATAVGTYEISLASYLPNDSYNYEILFSHKIYRPDDGDAFAYIYSDLVSADNKMDAGIANSNARQAWNCFYFPVGSGRTVYYQIYARKVNTSWLIANGYRRIGTNS